MQKTHYAGRRIKLDGQWYSVGEVIENPQRLRHLEALISSGQVYAVVNTSKLPPHVYSVVKQQGHDPELPDRNVFGAAKEAKEAHETNLQVRRSRAQAEVAQAQKQRTVVEGRVAWDKDAIEAAGVKFGESVVDDSKATEPEPDPEPDPDPDPEPDPEDPEDPGDGEEPQGMQMRTMSASTTSAKEEPREEPKEETKEETKEEPKKAPAKKTTTKKAPAKKAPAKKSQAKKKG